jgi:serine/threonine protein kinase
VFAADLPPLGRVAIKVASAGAERALAAEAFHLGHCAHPAIVRALGSCWTPGCSALALEHLAGGCLDDRFGAGPHTMEPGAVATTTGKGRRAPLTWHERLRVCYQVASALAYLHGSLRIVHCDIKPGAWTRRTILQGSVKCDLQPLQKVAGLQLRMSAWDSTGFTLGGGGGGG